MQREVSVASSQQGLTIEDAYRSRGLPDTDSSSGTTSDSWANRPRSTKFSKGGFCGTGVIFTARAMLAAAFALAILGFSFLGLAAYLLIRTPHTMSHLGSTGPITPQSYLNAENFTNFESVNESTIDSASQHAHTTTVNNLYLPDKVVNTNKASTHKPNRVLDYPHGRHPHSKARHHSEDLMLDAPWSDVKTTSQKPLPTEASTVAPRSFLGRLWDFVSLPNDV